MLRPLRTPLLFVACWFWQPALARSIPPPNLDSIQMSSPLVGWGTTETGLLHTVDGGRRWSNVTPFIPGSKGFSVGYLPLDILNGNIAWLAASLPLQREDTGAAIIFHTSDGGRHWQRLPALHLTPYDGRVSQLQFIDRQHGWAIVIRGANMDQIAFDIYHTADGGNQWRHVLSESDPQAAPVRPTIGGGLPVCDCQQGFTFVTPSIGWAGTDACGFGKFPASLYQSTNGGHSWRPYALPLPRQFHATCTATIAPTFFSSRVGILPILLTSSGGHSFLDVYHTGNGGRTWHGTTPVPSQFGVLERFVTPSNGFVLDETRILRTVDGGHHWRPLPSHLDGEHLVALDFVTPLIGFAIEGVGSSERTRLLETTNGGNGWAAA